MLGLERNEPFIVSGKYAKELRERLERYRTGNFNEEDKCMYDRTKKINICMIERSKKILNKYKAIWKD